MRYGGNTSCVEVRGSDGTVLVLDGGTGIRRLGASLEPEIRRVDILLTHLHMDHIQGLGFFAPLYQAEREVHIWGPPSMTLDLRARLARYFSPPFFPVRLREVQCRLRLHDVPLGCIQIGGLSVTAELVCHPGPTVGYRVADGPVAIAYLPDHEPALGARRFPNDPEWTSGFALAAGVDLLIHDAQYTRAEYVEREGWGHSAMRHAIAFAGLAGVRRLVTFHHDPSHEDAFLDNLLAAAYRPDLPFELIGGAEGVTFKVGDVGDSPGDLEPPSARSRA